MRTAIALAFSLLSVQTAVAGDNIDRKGKGDWCYAPVHMPSGAEQKAFVDEIIPAAKNAEKKYGVPAVMITGMAVVESGYGLESVSVRRNHEWIPLASIM